MKKTILVLALAGFTLGAFAAPVQTKPLTKTSTTTTKADTAKKKAVKTTKAKKAVKK
ncbi:hypothetical protein BDE36_0590 [Arcticibacter tournemirensis]|uniref:hypothetical protein n=1 Tax=Arcticibacter tournemirensis TaxID=699437 RepID=UPI00116C84DD|nr:hypothetical protein [Arcticibacter tournemirensis]TQM48899.1 hypothetical protein BDE36_0590 [Arcticibacter tournemirensis]